MGNNREVKSSQMTLSFFILHRHFVSENIMSKITLNSFLNFLWYSVQFSSVAQLCPTLCDPMNRSTPGLPVHYQLPEFTQTHIHRVSDAIQPSHPLSSPSPPASNPSQHQSLFKCVTNLNTDSQVTVHFSCQILTLLPEIWGYVT